MFDWELEHRIGAEGSPTRLPTPTPTLVSCGAVRSLIRELTSDKLLLERPFDLLKVERIIGIAPTSGHQASMTAARARELNIERTGRSRRCSLARSCSRSIVLSCQIVGDRSDVCAASALPTLQENQCK